MKPLFAIALLLAVPALAEKKERKPRSILDRPTIYVGVLEELRERDANARTNVGTANYKIHARVMFKKPITEWEGLPRRRDLSEAPNDFPPKLVWSACYQGKRVLSFESFNAPGYRFLSHIGSHLVPPGVRMPAADAEGNKFAGWREEKENRRPLVATTGGRCDDVDYWRKDEPPAKLSQIPFMIKLKEELAKTTWIEYPENENGNVAHGGTKNYKFRETEVKWGEFYSSRRTKAQVATLVVPGSDKRTHDEVFFIAPNGEISYIGSSLYFLDAADYDGSALSTLMFRMQSQFRDGYVLVDGNGRRLADFHWGYE